MCQKAGRRLCRNARDTDLIERSSVSTAHRVGPLITKLKRRPPASSDVFLRVDWRRSTGLKQRSAFAEALNDGRLSVAHPGMRRCRLCDGRFGPLKVERRIADRTPHREDRHPHQAVPLPAGRSVWSPHRTQVARTCVRAGSPTGRRPALLGWGRPSSFPAGIRVQLCATSRRPVRRGSVGEASAGSRWGPRQWTLRMPAQPDTPGRP